MVLSTVISRHLDTVWNKSFRILNFVEISRSEAENSRQEILEMYWIIGFFNNVFRLQGSDEKGLNACDFG